MYDETREKEKEAELERKRDAERERDRREKEAEREREANREWEEEEAKRSREPGNQEGVRTHGGVLGKVTDSATNSLGLPPPLGDRQEHNQVHCWGWAGWETA